MQKPVIFLATGDPDFEAVAVTAILKTAHAVRLTRTVESAAARLREGVVDIALAIIDLHLPGDGRGLLQIMGGCEPDFPIVAIVGSPGEAREETLAAIAMKILAKPVSSENLAPQIRAICARQLRSEPRRRAVSASIPPAASFSPSCISRSAI